jgi:DNA-binding beta-propeller fold protein YncE
MTTRRMSRGDGCALLLAAAVLIAPSIAIAQSEPPLQLEAKIPLGSVAGRIDHMAVDVARQRLFVAELGNNSVGVVDLKDRKVVHRVSGLHEPQGVGYVPATDMLTIANGGDGSVRVLSGESYADAGRLDLGDDADNIRVDTATNQVVVGYGGGALALIDATSRKKVAAVSLEAHPEAFQLGRDGSRIFVNVPSAHEIAVVDRGAGRQVASWPMRSAAANFPMALDEESKRVLVMFRSPAKLGVFGMQDGMAIAGVEACGDSDDVFVDAKRARVYASCGAGAIDVLDARTYQQLARIPTVAGARTSLFVPELDRLFVAVRAAAREPAAIWVFRPTP